MITLPPSRCIFRVIEFADGFDGTIAHTEVLFSTSLLAEHGEESSLTAIVQMCSTE